MKTAAGSERICALTYARRGENGAIRYLLHPERVVGLKGSVGFQSNKPGHPGPEEVTAKTGSPLGPAARELHREFDRVRQHPQLLKEIQDLPDVRLVDADVFHQPVPLHQLYTTAVQQGRGREAKAIVSAVLPGVIDLEILTEGNTPILHLVFEQYSVPAALCGDGIQMVLRLSLELAACAGGVVLLEEPEIHQHPGAIRQSARAILAAVGRGLQVILTTHSLELIDALLDQADDAALEKTAIYRVQLADNVLKSHRLLGPEARFARGQIEEDLR